jgi:hypothetical protein
MIIVISLLSPILVAGQQVPDGPRLSASSDIVAWELAPGSYEWVSMMERRLPQGQTLQEGREVAGRLAREHGARAQVILAYSAKTHGDTSLYSMPQGARASGQVRHTVSIADDVKVLSLRSVWGGQERGFPGGWDMLLVTPEYTICRVGTSKVDDLVSVTSGRPPVLADVSPLQSYSRTLRNIMALTSAPVSRESEDVCSWVVAARSSAELMSKLSVGSSVGVPPGFEQVGESVLVSMRRLDGGGKSFELAYRVVGGSLLRQSQLSVRRDGLPTEFAEFDFVPMTNHCYIETRWSLISTASGAGSVGGLDDILAWPFPAEDGEEGRFGGAIRFDPRKGLLSAAAIEDAHQAKLVEVQKRRLAQDGDLARDRRTDGESVPAPAEGALWWPYSVIGGLLGLSAVLGLAWLSRKKSLNGILLLMSLMLVGCGDSCGVSADREASSVQVSANESPVAVAGSIMRQRGLAIGGVGKVEMLPAFLDLPSSYSELLHGPIEIILRNGSPKVTRGLRVVTSCGCIGPTIGADTLEPGESTIVKLSVSRPADGGAISETVTVMWGGGGGGGGGGIGGSVVSYIRIASAIFGDLPVNTSLTATGLGR